MIGIGGSCDKIKNKKFNRKLFFKDKIAKKKIFVKKFMTKMQETFF